VDARGYTRIRALDRGQCPNEAVIPGVSSGRAAPASRLVWPSGHRPGDGAGPTRSDGPGWWRMCGDRWRHGQRLPDCPPMRASSETDALLDDWRAASASVASFGSTRSFPTLGKMSYYRARSQVRPRPVSHTYVVQYARDSDDRDRADWPRPKTSRRSTTTQLSISKPALRWAWHRS